MNWRARKGGPDSDLDSKAQPGECAVYFRVIYLYPLTVIR
jgi:hypothetical protein